MSLAHYNNKSQRKINCYLQSICQQTIPKTNIGAKVLHAACSQLRHVANTWIAGFPTFLIRLEMQNQKGLEPEQFTNKSFRQNNTLKLMGIDQRIPRRSGWSQQSRRPRRWNNMEKSIQSIPAFSIFLRTSIYSLQELHYICYTLPISPTVSCIANITQLYKERCKISGSLKILKGKMGKLKTYLATCEIWRCFWDLLSIWTHRAHKHSPLSISIHWYMRSYMPEWMQQPTAPPFPRNFVCSAGPAVQTLEAKPRLAQTMWKTWHLIFAQNADWKLKATHIRYQ